MMAGMMFTKALNHHSSKGWSPKRSPNPHEKGTAKHFLHEFVEDVLEVNNPVAVFLAPAVAPVAAATYILDVVKDREQDAKTKQALSNATAKAKKEVEKNRDALKSTKTKLTEDYDKYREDFKKRNPDKTPEKKKNWTEKAENSPKDLHKRYQDHGGKQDFQTWKARYYDPWHKSASEETETDTSRKDFIRTLQEEMPLDAFPAKGRDEFLAMVNFFFKKQGWEEPTEAELSKNTKEGSLRSATIRLANLNPELRKHLVPLLRATR
jgi:uncharacterized short protein YbdD (DUF466 family)